MMPLSSCATHESAERHSRSTLVSLSAPQINLQSATSPVLHPCSLTPSYLVYHMRFVVSNSSSTAPCRLLTCRCGNHELHGEGSEGGPCGRCAHRHYLRPGVSRPELRGHRQNLRHQRTERTEAAGHLRGRNPGYL